MEDGTPKWPRNDTLSRSPGARKSIEWKWFRKSSAYMRTPFSVWSWKSGFREFTGIWRSKIDLAQSSVAGVRSFIIRLLSLVHSSSFVFIWFPMGCRPTPLILLGILFQKSIEELMTYHSSIRHHLFSFVIQLNRIPERNWILESRQRC